jgi:hypothetical protein
MVAQRPAERQKAEISDASGERDGALDAAAPAERVEARPRAGRVGETVVAIVSGGNAS